MITQKKLVSTTVVLIGLLVLQFLYPQQVSAVCAPNHIIYVDASASGAATGCSWTDAFLTLQDALAVASGTDPDQIWVANGTYYPDEGSGQTNNDQNSTFTLIDGVNVYGGFAGGETLLSQRNPTLNIAILSGDIDQSGTAAGNAFTVVTIIGALTDTYVLDGFTITGGNQTTTGIGGGIYVDTTSPTFGNLIITANNANSRGGGVFIITPSATLEANYSRPSFTDVTISNNTATIGGGVYVQNGSPSFTRVTFSGNTVTGGAGGGLNIQTFGGTGVDEPNLATLTEVTFTNNTGNGGGGLYNNNSTTTLNRVTFSGNTANRRGGGILNEQSNPILTNVTFSGNTSNESVGVAPWGGGGIMNLGSDPVLNNVTFNGNNSVNGSGTAGGDAMKNMTDLGVSSDPVITNSIFWGDGGISDEILTVGISTATITDSVVQGGCPALATCTNVINSDPILSALANNGGFTQTMAISSTGSAFNAADTTTADCAATDQRGTSRPQGVACDIGAYEVGDTVAPILQSFTRFNPATSPTNADTLVFRATFNETVINVSTGDFAVNGTTTATVTLVTPISGTVYEITVSSGDLAGFNGVVGINLSGAQNITDSAGNALPAGEPATDETYLVDNTAPTVTIDQAVAQADPTNVSPINFTVVFSEATTNFATGDVTLGGTAGATTAIVTGGPITFNVAVSGMTGDGTVIASIAAGVATDATGNGNTASTSTDNTVTYDTTAPTVTIDQAVAQADPTGTSPINFTVVFSEATTNFATGDVTLGGTAGATTAIVTGGPITFNVAVSGMTGDGTVIASIVAAVATDAAGNSNAASTSTDNTVTYDTTGPVVTIGAPSVAITTAGPVDFPITITGGTTFNLTVADVTLNTTGTATGTVSVTNGNTANPTVTISATTGSGTIGISIAAGVASDGSGNTSAAAGPSATFIVDNGGPVVTASVPANTATVTGPTQITVTYNEDVQNLGVGGAANTANYLLVEAGVNTAFDTVSCLLGVAPDDVAINVDSAAYSNGGGSGPFVATLNINGGVPLPVGTYQLYVCGTTSVQDLAGNELNDGLADTIIQFTVIAGTAGGGGTQRASAAPATGFAQGEFTSIPLQPADKAYTATNLWIEIPRLGIKMTIVGVPQTKDGWDVTWLGRDAGWLNGSAFPTWQGNSVLTGHVWTENNKPGPFNKLKDLQYGDQVKIHAFGQVFAYEIRESALIDSTDTKSMLKHEEKTWLTLITCEGLNENTGVYLYRRMVRAVLVSVTTEK